MSAMLSAAELEAIRAAAAALSPPQRTAFQELVASHLASLPCAAVGPGSLHRIIALCQHAVLKTGVLAVGPPPNHGKRDAVAARAWESWAKAKAKARAK